MEEAISAKCGSQRALSMDAPSEPGVIICSQQACLRPIPQSQCQYVGHEQDCPIYQKAKAEANDETRNLQ